MKTSMTESRCSGLKRRLLMLAVPVGISGSQPGCGCECAAIEPTGDRTNGDTALLLSDWLDLVR
jgi:hypothetical protein